MLQPTPQRVQLTLAGSAAVWHQLLVASAADGPPAPLGVVLPLFRAQGDRLVGAAQQAAARAEDLVFQIQTVCFRENGSYLLPSCKLAHTPAVRVARTALAALPVTVREDPVSFPTYAAEILERTMPDVTQAGSFMAQRGLVPGYQGAEAAQSAMADIFIGALEAEERHPGLLLERATRPGKQYRHWLCWVFRNQNAMYFRRLRRGQRGNQLGIREESADWLQAQCGDMWWPTAAPSAEMLFLQSTDGLRDMLARLPADVQEVLLLVARVGVYQAGRELHSDRRVQQALAQARIVLAQPDAEGPAPALLPTPPPCVCVAPHPSSGHLPGGASVG